MKASECCMLEGNFCSRLIKIDADRKEHITHPFQPLTCANRNTLKIIKLKTCRYERRAIANISPGT